MPKPIFELAKNSSPTASGEPRLMMSREADWIIYDEASKLPQDMIEYRPSPWQKEWLEEFVAVQDDPKLQAIFKKLQVELDKEVTRTLTEPPKAAEIQPQIDPPPPPNREAEKKATAPKPDQDKEGWGTF